MSGQYSGLQARIKSLNPLADYVPCAGHSLNLVGTFSAECCTNSVKFFDMIQKIYNFFSSSTSRWGLLKEHIENVKACNLIETNKTETAACKLQVKAIAKYLKSLEFGIMICMWNKILNRFNATNLKLQSVNIDMETVIQLYTSLENYIDSLRATFDDIEKDGINLTKEKLYKKDTTRMIKRKVIFDDEDNDEEFVSGKMYFKRNTFFVIIDSLISCLRTRKETYTNHSKIYGCIPCLFKQPNINLISESCINLANRFSSDIEGGNLLKDESLTNCSGEHSFSALKRIKNCLRSTTTSTRLNALSILNIENELLQSLDYSDIITEFATRKSRKTTFFS
ncbi:hypothetical protein AGLY_018245 [Aphis glycines]|uniref:HAT C-terminal dimerisation domain-containing protein n=1 Tax=Aphis glycines TaxID=307491 RepID=A0A6G0STD9_APHGL|nr:hypothetical protein AGLY_018245 [Aphis glycines]